MNNLYPVSYRIRLKQINKIDDLLKMLNKKGININRSEFFRLANNFLLFKIDKILAEKNMYQKIAKLREDFLLTLDE